MSNGDRPSTWARLTVAMLTVGAVVALGSQVHAVEAIVVSPSTVRGGGAVTVTGSDWTCSGEIEVFLGQEGDTAMLVETIPFGDHADGTFEVVLVAPIGDGDYDVTASYDASSASSGCGGEASASFTVIAPIPSTTSTTSTTAPSATTTTLVDSGSGTTTTTAPSATTTTLVDSGSGTTTTTTAATTTTLVDSEATTTTAATTTTLVDSGAATTTTDPGATSTTLTGNNAATTTTGPSGRLPITGGSSFDFVPYAIVIASFGGLLVLATRRKLT